MNTVTYSIPKISCGHCVHTIETELGDLAGVQNVKASQETREVTVSFDPPTDETRIKELLLEINYPVSA
jgi:copper chaperone